MLVHQFGISQASTSALCSDVLWAPKQSLLLLLCCQLAGPQGQMQHLLLAVAATMLAGRYSRKQSLPLAVLEPIADSHFLLKQFPVPAESALTFQHLLMLPPLLAASRTILAGLNLLKKSLLLAEFATRPSGPDMPLKLASDLTYQISTAQDTNG